MLMFETLFWSGELAIYDVTTDCQIYQSFSKMKPHNSIRHRRKIKHIITSYYYVTRLVIGVI